MGIQIETYVEIKHPETGEWMSEFGELIPNPHYEDGEGVGFINHNANIFTLMARLRAGVDIPSQVHDAYPFTVSNRYSVTAMLSDYVTDKDVLPIASKRGLPKNVSPEVKTLQSQSAGSHQVGFSYLLLSELLAYDWSEVFMWGDKPISYLKAAQESLLWRTIENMKELGEPENVRLVFWFNN